MNSDSLRTAVRDLETTAEQAGARLIQAETDHRAALRRAVEAGDFTISIASEAALADAAETARSLDTDFAKLVGALHRLKEREFALHRQAKDAFRSPWASSRLLSTAARPIATFLATLANGGTPDVEDWIAKSVAIGAANIRGTYDAGV